jgi:hypothetical protein
MHFNPFRPSRLAGAGMFAGRHEEIYELDRTLHQAREGNPQHFLLTGERGIGKSSLLLAVKVMAEGEVDEGDPNAYKFLIVELELGAAYTYRNLIKRLSTGLRKALSPYAELKEGVKKVWEVVKRIEAAGVKYNSAAGKEDFELFEDLIEAFVAAADTISGELDGILVLIDEADKAPVSANLGSFVEFRRPSH